MVSLQQVDKRYGDVWALRNLSLELAPGQVHAILGPNGAGKTTALSLMLGLTRPTAGQVRVFDQVAHRRSMRGQIGAMLQVSGLPDTLKVEELLTLFRSYYPQPIEKKEVIEMAQLAELLPRRYGRLSGGQQQRLLFGLAICGNPQLLFLDEPTVGMDVALRNRFWSVIRMLAGEGRTIILTTHYMDEADALADHIVVMHQGALVAEGSPARIKSLVPQGRVRCRTRLSADTVAALPEANHVCREGGLLTITTTQTESIVRKLLAADADLSELEVGKADLTQAFLHLTGDQSAAAAA